MKYAKIIEPGRRAWRERQIQRCMICHCAGHVTLDVHEMLTRGRFPTEWGFDANYLLLCRLCHDRVHRENWTYLTQLVVKLDNDPESFDLDLFNAVKRGEPITLEDLNNAVYLGDYRTAT